MFYVLQWNVRSLTANGQKLKGVVEEFKEMPEIITTQESWLKPHLEFIIQGDVSERKDGIDRSGGGCATFIKIGTQCQRRAVNTTLECVVTEVWTETGRINIGNMYNPLLDWRLKCTQHLMGRPISK